MIVVDVGNTRIKWGRCAGDRVVETASLPPDAPDAWQRQLEAWAIEPMASWVVSGVHPGRRDSLIAWLRAKAAVVQVLDSFGQLPLTVRVDDPAKVGIDRLLNAVAANTRRPARSIAVIIDAGSAVTVDLVDESGAFRGGAIYPGLRLMARALHEHTALLPLVDFERADKAPATSTVAAIRAGIISAVLGGYRRLIFRYMEPKSCPDCQPTTALPEVRVLEYITGGDAPFLLAAERPGSEQHWPEMTLHGILHSIPNLHG